MQITGLIPRAVPEACGSSPPPLAKQQPQGLPLSSCSLITFSREVFLPARKLPGSSPFPLEAPPHLCWDSALSKVAFFLLRLQRSPCLPFASEKSPDTDLPRTCPYLYEMIPEQEKGSHPGKTLLCLTPRRIQPFSFSVS